ncbi:MAG TPA: S26 family signal peptidase [Phycisphaerae bacterium]|nr:S26 family signal peptidase [Phycisphaerae bacterium]
MQCTNCGFQNMPGSEVCGRCSTGLGLATAVVDVNPPRAGSLSKYFRRVLPVRMVYFRTRSALHAENVAARVRHATATLPPRPLILRLIVPGWSHFYIKQPFRGHLFLWGFVACLLPTFLYFGTTWGSIWLGMAFSVHSSAALDIVTQSLPGAGVRDRIVRSIIVSAILGLVLYLPAMWLIGGFAGPHTVQTDLVTFRTGDVLLVNRWEAPRRGEVVLYEFNYNTMLAPGYGERETVQYAGENIDRILAMPGDHVQCNSGRLLINGSPSLWQPLNPRPLPKEISLTVPDDHYLILPSGVPGLAGLQDANLWLSAGNISRADIVGRAYLQIHPLSQFHFIR